MGKTPPSWTLTQVLSVPEWPSRSGSCGWGAGRGLPVSSSPVLPGEDRLSWDPGSGREGSWGEASRWLEFIWETSLPPAQPWMAGGTPLEAAAGGGARLSLSSMDEAALLSPWEPTWWAEGREQPEVRLEAGLGWGMWRLRTGSEPGPGSLPRECEPPPALVLWSPWCHC